MLLEVPWVYGRGASGEGFDERGLPAKFVNSGCLVGRAEQVPGDDSR